jgi:hypothetical protein
MLAAAQLPPGFERWRLEIGPLTERPTHAREWAGAIVLVESGVLEAICELGGFRRFVAGDLLALGWLPLVRLRNPGREPVRLVAVRRRGHVSTAPTLDVRRPAGSRVP